MWTRIAIGARHYCLASHFCFAVIIYFLQSTLGFLQLLFFFFSLIKESLGENRPFLCVCSSTFFCCSKKRRGENRWKCCSLSSFFKVEKWRCDPSAELLVQPKACAEVWSWATWKKSSTLPVYLKLSVYLHFYLNKAGILIWGLWWECGGSDVACSWGGCKKHCGSSFSKCPCPNKADGIQPKAWPRFPPENLWAALTQQVVRQTHHTAVPCSLTVVLHTASWCLCLVVLELPLEFLILVVQILKHLCEFAHLDVCAVTDGKTAVDVILHVVGLARQSPRCAKVVPVRKWRWAVLLPQNIGRFDANNATEMAL